MAEPLKLGTVVADAIVPGNPDAAAQYAEYTQGGLHTGKADLPAIYAITTERRQWGMEAKTETGATYELIRGLFSQDITDNRNWRLKPSGPSGPATPAVTVVQTTGASTADVMSQDAVTRELGTKAATTHTHTASQVTDFSAAADARIELQKVLAGLLATVDPGTGKIYASLIPGQSREVLPFNSLADFPATGDPELLYIARDTHRAYVWDGSGYTPLDAGAVTSFNGRTGNVTLTQADVDAFLGILTARVTEAEGDINQLEIDVLRIDGEVGTIQDLIPANASPTNKLVTVADLSSGGGPGTTMSFVATRTVGGINAGTTVIVDNNASGNSLKLMLAPADGPNANLSADRPVRQPGATTAVALSYNVSAATYPIATIVVNGQTVTATSGTVAASTPANTDTSFSMQVTDTQGMQTSRSTSVIYRPLRFWGPLGVDPLTLSDGDLSQLIRGLSSEFSTDRQQTRSITANSEYLVFAGRASAWGGAQYEVNGLSNNAFQGRTFNFTNSEGYTESFYVVRGGQRLVGTFTATVK
jgi:hypothetical protein